MSTNILIPNDLTLSSQAANFFPKPPKGSWLEAARKKGFDIAARIIDRYHLALRCRVCGAVHKSKVFTLMSAQPQCPACLEQEWRRDAEAAGLVYLTRDPSDRHYCSYRASCGHEVRRQIGLVKRIAAGDTGLRCETCHAATEAAEATDRGWTLLGPDPMGNANYRAYRHDDCGQTHRIARANMQSGRFMCPVCDEGWAADPSYIYAMAFTLATGREVVKLGFSRDPDSRLDYQLRLDPEMPCEIIRKIAMPSGHAAIRTEKRMHGTLKRRFPDAVVAPSAWHGQIRVRSEIYDASLTPVILSMLDKIEASDRAG